MRKAEVKVEKWDKTQTKVCDYNGLRSHAILKKYYIIVISFFPFYNFLNFSLSISITQLILHAIPIRLGYQSDFVGYWVQFGLFFFFFFWDQYIVGLWNVSGQWYWYDMCSYLVLHC
jgi:hypothetical protein